MAVQIKLIVMLTVGMLLITQQKNNRSIYIFSNTPSDSNVVQQLNILKTDPKGLNDRNIIFKVITTTDVAVMAPYKNWHVPPTGFTVILIGKDNGEKLRSHSPVSLTKLYNLIDSMPMRQQEINNKHQ